MKNVMKFGVALMLLTASSMFANVADFSIRAKGGKMVNVTTGDAKVHMSIYTADKELLFEEDFKGTKNTSRTYDLKDFPDGTYYMEAETSAKITRYAIKISNGIAFVADNAIAETYKPVLSQENGKVTVNIPNADKKPVQIAIFAGSQEVYSKSYNQANVTQQFDFSPAASESYTLVMKYDDRTFYQTVAAN